MVPTHLETWRINRLMQWWCWHGLQLLQTSPRLWTAAVKKYYSLLILFSSIIISVYLQHVNFFLYLHNKYQLPSSNAKKICILISLHWLPVESPPQEKGTILSFTNNSIFKPNFLNTAPSESATYSQITVFFQNCYLAISLLLFLLRC